MKEKKGLLNRIFNNKDIFIKKTKKLNKKIGNLLLVLLMMLQSFIGYVPMMIVNAAPDPNIIEVSDFNQLNRALSMMPSAEGKTIKLQNYIPITGTIEPNLSNVTVDLNGFGIFLYPYVDTVFNINKSMNITFTNSSYMEASFYNFSPNNSARAFYITPFQNQVITIDNIKFRDFNSTGLSNDNGGVISVSRPGNTQINIKNSTFMNNQSSGNGGVIYSRSNNINIENSEFKDNKSLNGEGGAIYNENGTISISDNSKFTNNNANTGGAISSNNNKVTINNSNFTGNISTISGGAIYSENPSYNEIKNIIISNTTFDENRISTTDKKNLFGGALHVKNTKLTLANNTNITNNTIIGNNDLGGFGGGLALENSNVTIYNSHIKGNKINTSTKANGAGIYVDGNSKILETYKSEISENTVLSTITNGNGGGIYLERNSTANISDITFNGNSAVKGGAIYNNGVTDLKLNMNDFISNKTTSTKSNISNCFGGAVYNNSGSSGTITNNNFDGNSAYNGGAIANLESSITFSGNTFKDNNATSQGGGVWIQDNKTALTYENNNFEGNSATLGGGIYLYKFPISDLEVFPITIKGGNFKNNEGTHYGGGIYASDVNFTVDGVHLNNNFTGTKNENGINPSGGGIYSINSSINLANNTIEENNAIWGGGVFTQINDKEKEYKVTFTNNDINNNTALDPDDCSGEYCGAGGGVNITFNEDVDVDFNINSGRFIGNKAADGGAIFFGYPWTSPSADLVLKKALITNNSASRGGGVWLCPQAKTNMYSSLGAEIYGNTASGDVTYEWNYGKRSQTLKSAGDDILYEGDAGEEKQFSSTLSRTSLKVSSRSWAGHKIDWYKDENKNRYSLGNRILADREYLQGINGTGTKKHVALHGNNEINERDASLIMTDNQATRRGGAIFTNNVIDFGVHEDIDLTVNKKFIVDKKEYNGEYIPESVYINLYRIDKDGNEELLDSNIELNRENKFTYIFRDLPARYGEDESEVYKYTVRETDESNLIDKTSDNGEDGICNTDKDCKIILRNSVNIPKLTPVKLTPIEKIIFPPNTSDKAGQWIMLLWTSILGIYFVLKYKREVLAKED